LQLSIDQKLTALGDILDELAQTREFVTLAEVAAETQRDE
jgi:hypothetical protein